jgi:hypothetical protein
MSNRNVRWFQVSLKSLFLLTLLAAAFFAGWSMEERRAKQAIQDARDVAEAAQQQVAQARAERMALEQDRMGRTIPCHPGCFPAGTLVHVPQGTTPIERVRQGDSVITVSADGQPAVGNVVSVFRTRNRLVNVRTDAGSLETTETQPLCLATGELRAAAELKPGDTIWRWNGAARTRATVHAVKAGRMAAVFNLVLGDPTIFIAGDFLVRSKPPPDGVTRARGF